MKTLIQENNILSSYFPQITKTKNFTTKQEKLMTQNTFSNLGRKKKNRALKNV